mmetsp:Transcript_14923/g.23224  ORF Transcript_14923/g.23224 Transcript_14923/m.23224 type:complete len:150 (-) Transcript_14923:1218-1667(-)
MRTHHGAASITVFPHVAMWASPIFFLAGLAQLLYLPVHTNCDVTAGTILSDTPMLAHFFEVRACFAPTLHVPMLAELPGRANRAIVYCFAMWTCTSFSGTLTLNLSVLAQPEDNRMVVSLGLCSWHDARSLDLAPPHSAQYTRSLPWLQ